LRTKEKKKKSAATYSNKQGVEFKNLLVKNQIIEINQEKWFKDMIQSDRIIINQIYILQITKNKRELTSVDNKLVVSNFFNLTCFI
jgi:hypothetical protein